MMKRTHRALTEVGFPTSSMDGFLEWNHEWNSLLFACSCIRAGCLYALHKLGVCHILLYICASIVRSRFRSFTPNHSNYTRLARCFKDNLPVISNNRNVHRTKHSFRIHSSPNPFIFRVHQREYHSNSTFFSNVHHQQEVTILSVCSRSNHKNYTPPFCQLSRFHQRVVERGTVKSFENETLVQRDSWTSNTWTSLGARGMTEEGGRGEQEHREQEQDFWQAQHARGLRACA